MKHLNSKPNFQSKISGLIEQTIVQIRQLEADRPRFVYPFVTEVYKELHVESAHLLPNHDAKCKFLHGHSYKVGITVRGQLWDGIGDTTEGMVLDFKELKEMLKQDVDSKFDHAYLNQVMNIGVPSLSHRDYKQLALRTTAEQMAWFIFVTLYEVYEMSYKEQFNDMRPSSIEKYPFEIVQVDVWETTTSKATAKRENFDYETYRTNLYASAYADDDVNKKEPVHPKVSNKTAPTLTETKVISPPMKPVPYVEGVAPYYVVQGMDKGLSLETIKELFYAVPVPSFVAESNIRKPLATNFEETTGEKE